MEITRKIEFDAGHRVFGHESKCAHLHGHRYVIELTVASAALDEIGRVIDFSVLKTVVGAWVDEHWDHNTLLHKDDPLLPLIDTAINGKDVYVMLQGNPTAENMARELFEQAIMLLRPFYIDVVKVRIYETPNCWAEWTNQDA